MATMTAIAPLVFVSALLSICVFVYWGVVAYVRRQRARAERRQAKQSVDAFLSTYNPPSCRSDGKPFTGECQIPLQYPPPPYPAPPSPPAKHTIKQTIVVEAVEPIKAITYVKPYQPRIVFCTTCKGRTQHLEQTLPQNIANNRDYDNCVFVVLDYNSPDHLLEYLKTSHASDIASGKVVVYSSRAPGPFQMAHAKNMAHRCGMLEGADILVNLDADNFTGWSVHGAGGVGFAQYIAHDWMWAEHENENIFLWAEMIKDAEGRLPRGISGRIAVTKDAFLKAGGYDEKFSAWGPDDKDFNLRLARLGYTGYKIIAPYLNAILHNDKMRFKEYKHAAQPEANEDMIVHEEGTPAVANDGNFGCGTVYRNFSGQPIELTPLPTRIFGIGMHKTGTTSLHKALVTLGYDSAHWENAHWAKRIWMEMGTLGHSPTLERHYALCDLPIPMLYKELDRAYPGSKFILTIRDGQKWLKSIRNHWNPARNPYRAQWDTDPVSHKLHNALYGRKTFDEDTMMRRYFQHNSDVTNYFIDRPNDLLVVRVAENTGWEPLCGFLGVPVPDVPYPWEFATGTEYFTGDGEGI